MVATEIVSTRISRPLRSSAPKSSRGPCGHAPDHAAEAEDQEDGGGDQHAFERQEVELLDATRRQEAAGRGIAPDDQGKRHALHADDDRERPDDERVQIELEGRRE